LLDLILTPLASQGGDFYGQRPRVRLIGMVGTHSGFNGLEGTRGVFNNLSWEDARFEVKMDGGRTLSVPLECLDYLPPEEDKRAPEAVGSLHETALLLTYPPGHRRQYDLQTAEGGDRILRGLHIPFPKGCVGDGVTFLAASNSFPDVCAALFAVMQYTGHLYGVKVGGVAPVPHVHPKPLTCRDPKPSLHHSCCA
jgi:hypothetical protein